MNETELQEIEMEAAIYESVADPDHPMLLNVKTLLSTVRELQRQVAERDNELETERLRLAACGTAAIGYFTDCKDEYRSASLDDVLRLLKRADELQRQVQEREADARRYTKLRDMLLDTDFGLYVRVGDEWGPVTQIDELDSIIDDFAPKDKPHER